MKPAKRQLFDDLAATFEEEFRLDRQRDAVRHRRFEAVRRLKSLGCPYFTIGRVAALACNENANVEMCKRLGEQLRKQEKRHRTRCPDFGDGPSSIQSDLTSGSKHEVNMLKRKITEVWYEDAEDPELDEEFEDADDDEDVDDTPQKLTSAFRGRGLSGRKKKS